MSRMLDGHASKRIDNPRVSVIVPTYNRANELRRCLDSLVTQTFKDFEVLICDDGSTDKTSKVIEDYTVLLDIRYEYDHNFGGPARARNRGVKLARGEYVAFLDSDDWWAPAKLEKSLGALEGGADVVFHDLWIVSHSSMKDRNGRIISHQPQVPVFESLLCTAVSIPNSSLIIRLSALRSIGGICEDRELIAVEDFDMLLRLSKVTENFVKIPGCLGFYCTGETNISKASSIQILRTKTVYQRHLNDLDDFNRKRADAVLAYRIGRIAQLQGNWSEAVPSLLMAVRGRLSFGYKLKALWILSAKRIFS